MSVSLHLIPATRKQQGLWYKHSTMYAAGLFVWIPASHGTILWCRLIGSAYGTSAGIKFPENKKKNQNAAQN